MILGPKKNSEPGPYRVDRTPQLEEVMDALSNPKIQKVVVVAPAQSGKSQAGRNWLARCIDQDPGPMLIVFPSEDAAKEQIADRIIPMFTDCPKLAEHVTGRAWDMKQSQVITDTCTIYVGWAGSPQALASRPIRLILMDEVDKYPHYRGKEADPISLADVRTRTYGHRRTILLISTPTIPEGPIWRAYQASPDRRTFHVHCPDCGEHADLAWKNIRWEGIEAEDHDSLMEQLIAFDSGLLKAEYSLPCGCRTFGDAERWEYVLKGAWYSEVECGETTEVAFKVSGLGNPWTTFTKLAREYVSARLTGVERIHHFFNSELGEPFWAMNRESEDQSTEIAAKTIWAKSYKGHPRDFVPSWARQLIASADTGKVYHWTVVAWGEDYRSRTISFGIAESLAELKAATIDRAFQMENSAVKVKPRKLWIDSGGTDDMTERVYRFSQGDARIMPLKGYGGQTKPLKPVNTNQHKTPQGLTVRLSIVDVNYFKDLVAARINADDDTLWEVVPVSKDFAMHMAAERKILVKREIYPDGRPPKEVWSWQPHAVGTPNHFWDTAVYNAAGAYAADAGTIAREIGKQVYGYEPAKDDDDWVIGR